MNTFKATAGVLGVVVGLGLALRAAGADLFVGPPGAAAPGADGSRAHPFATPEQAREAVRALKKQGPLPAGGVVVWLGGGDYVRTNAFELTAEDAGTADAPVVWRGSREAPSRWLGGRRLEGFQPVTDPAVLNRLDPAARGRVLACDLRALGITGFGRMQSRGFSRAAVPAHAELFHGGRPMTLARWPNEGAFEQIAGFPEKSGQNDGHGGSIGDLPDGFRFAGDRPLRWRDPTNAWVHGYWAWDWANSYERIASLDAERHLIRTAPPHGIYGFRKNQRIFYLNVLEELDQPGEWYLEAGTGVLYFWPPAAVGTDQPETLLSLLDQPLVRLSGVSFVSLEGFTLEATRGSAVEIRGGLSNRVVGCRIRNIGNTGVVVDGGTGHGVEGCDVVDTGDGGVSLTGGDRTTLTAGGHFVDNCHFQRQGRWSKCYVPAVHLQGVGLRASHNLIHDHPHCGILYWGNDHRIEFNEIHHVALETGDVGAIYTGRDYTFRGNRIRHNYIHHVGGVGMGSMGAYMDDCVSGTEIVGNIFLEVQRAAFLGGGRDHRVENNIFVNCHHAVELDGRGLDRSPVWRGMVDDTMRKSLKAVPSALYRGRYPAMRSLDAYYGPPEGPSLEGESFRGVPPEGNVVARNVCVGDWLRVDWNAKEDMLQLDRNLTGRDPGFVGKPGPEAKAADFALRPDSPAWALGFEAIPVASIGLQDAGPRRVWLGGGAP